MDIIHVEQKLVDVIYTNVAHQNVDVRRSLTEAGIMMIIVQHLIAVKLIQTLLNEHVVEILSIYVEREIFI